MRSQFILKPKFLLHKSVQSN